MTNIVQTAGAVAVGSSAVLGIVFMAYYQPNTVLILALKSHQLLLKLRYLLNQSRIFFCVIILQGFLCILEAANSMFRYRYQSNVFHKYDGATMPNEKS